MSDHHHGHSHSHSHSGPIKIGDTAARVVVGLLVVIGVAVLVGLVWLWPSKQHVEIPLPMQNAGGGAVTTEAGTVVMQEWGPCGSPSLGRVFPDDPAPPRANTYDCQRSIITIDSGPHAGNKTLFEIAPGPGQPELHAGDKIRLVRQSDPSGAPMYSFEDYARGLPLTLIVLAFVIVIVAVARWRGLRALLGLGFAFGVLVMFLLPALLDGKPAIPVALVAGSLILYAVLYLAHGVNLRTSSALLGTLTSMLLAAALSWVAIEITHLTGLSEEQNTNVATYIEHVSITGLLLAGFIIGSLGVLNDVTITQAAAAFELAALDEQASRRDIFAATMRVGRDHIASTVYTLVLAYAGGALPLLLLFSVAGRSIRDVLTGDAVAIEITRSAVGGICLALSVPLTTGIAVMLARPFHMHRTAPTGPASRGKRPAARARRTGARPAARRTRTGEQPTVSGRNSALATGEQPAATARKSARATGDPSATPGRGAAPATGEQPIAGPHGDEPPTHGHRQSSPGTGEQTTVPRTSTASSGEQPSWTLAAQSGAHPAVPAAPEPPYTDEYPTDPQLRLPLTGELPAWPPTPEQPDPPRRPRHSKDWFEE